MRRKKVNVQLAGATKNWVGICVKPTILLYQLVANYRLPSPEPCYRDREDWKHTFAYFGYELEIMEDLPNLSLIRTNWFLL